MVLTALIPLRIPVRPATDIDLSFGAATKCGGFFMGRLLGADIMTSFVALQVLYLQMGKMCCGGGGVCIDFFGEMWDDYGKFA